MASSMMKCKSKTIWSSDVYLEIIIFYFLKLIRRFLENGNSLDILDKNWLENYYENLYYALRGFSNGAIDFELDEIIAAPFKKIFFNNSLLEIKEIIQSKGKYIEIDELNEIENIKPTDHVYWENNLKTEIIINLIDDLLKLIQEE